MTRYNISQEQKQLALDFHALHHTGTTLILPNAWDAVSAVLYEKAGFQAIGTTSSGVAWSSGYSDGEYTPINIVLDVIQRMSTAVNVPVTADIEAGYYKNDMQFKDFMRKVILAGAVGINLEDSNPRTGKLMPPEHLRKLIKIVKEVREELDIQIFINARVDGMILNDRTDNEKIDISIKRAEMYKESGADGIFVPFVEDFESVVTLKDNIALPLNILMNRFLDVAKLKDINIARVSVGGRPLMSLMHRLKELSRMMMDTDEWSQLYIDDPTYEELNSYFK